ncbi:MAG: cytochrome b N-terminal domain-containing protein [Cyanobacteria bacterium J06555_3]
MNSLKLNLYLRRIATIGAIALLTLASIAALSGIAIAFYYQPTAAAAHQSLAQIESTIPNGWLILSLHNWAGNSIIVVSLIQIVVLFLGRQFRRSWLTAWISGILLTLSTIGLGWTAMILAWNQLGFWRLKVELSIIESVPVVGTAIRNILTGGSGINTTTIVHFYTIHSYVLSIAAIALSLIHLAALITQEQETKGLLLQQLEKLIARTADKKIDQAESASSKI